MKRNKKIKFSITSFVIFLALIVIVFFVSLFQIKQNSKPEITSDLINNRLVEAKELTTLKYYYTNMGKFENQNDFYGWKVPFTTKSFIVSYDGIINVGVNLNNSTIDLKDKNIKITIPNSEILSHEIDENSLQVFLEKDSIFNPLKIEDYQGFSKDQKQDVERKAISKGLLIEANEKSEKAIRQLLKMGGDLEGYTIKVEFK